MKKGAIQVDIIWEEWRIISLYSTSPPFVEKHIKTKIFQFYITLESEKIRPPFPWLTFYKNSFNIIHFSTIYGVNKCYNPAKLDIILEIVILKCYGSLFLFKWLFFCAVMIF